MSVSVCMSVSAYKSVSVQLIVREKCGGDGGEWGVWGQGFNNIFKISKRTSIGLF